MQQGGSAPRALEGEVQELLRIRAEVAARLQEIDEMLSALSPAGPR